MPFIHNDHMVQQIASTAADPTLGNTILPRTSEAGSLGLNAEALNCFDHFAAEVCTAIKDQVSGGSIEWECLAQLLNALRQVQDISRHPLITVLLNMRDELPFKDIREILQEHRLLLSQPRAKDEHKARFILSEIIRLADKDHTFSEHFKLAQGAALRSLERLRSDQYEAQLYRVFPALRPTYNFR
jgi:hypothetical protein